MVTFNKAVRQGSKVIVGLSGPSGSGKTLSALKLARGLAGGDDGIFFVDTENGRGLHYAPKPNESKSDTTFDFNHVNMKPPFSSVNYTNYLDAAVKAGAKVIIVDSMSHEHEGVGGMLDQHESELEKMAGSDWRKRERVKFTAWIKPKSDHQKFVNAALQCDAHLIFCFRAKEKLKMEKNDKGKNEPVPQGWTPICSGNFQYEMTTLLMLPDNAKGVPDLSIGSTKLQEAHKSIFVPNKPICEDMGVQLLEWAGHTVDKTETKKRSDETQRALEAALNSAVEIAGEHGMEKAVEFAKSQHAKVQDFLRVPENWAKVKSAVKVEG